MATTYKSRIQLTHESRGGVEALDGMKEWLYDTADLILHPQQMMTLRLTPKVMHYGEARNRM